MIAVDVEQAARKMWFHGHSVGDISRKLGVPADSVAALFKPPKPKKKRKRRLHGKTVTENGGG